MNSKQELEPSYTWDTKPIVGPPTEKREMPSMTPKMKALIQRVEREMTINQSVATLNTGIAAQIQTGNRVSLHALVESLREEHVAVARAILAHAECISGYFFAVIRKTT